MHTQVSISHENIQKKLEFQVDSSSRLQELISINHYSHEYFLNYSVDGLR